MAKIRSALVALMMALLVAGVMSRRVLEAAAVTVSDDELFMSKSQFEKLISAFSGLGSFVPFGARVDALASPAVKLANDLSTVGND